jgi:hypothetical protein
LLHIAVIDVLLRICQHFKRGEWGVALFAVHPVMVSTVGYVIQSSVMMAALFMGWAFLMWARRRFVLSLAMCVLAAMSKQNAWVFPVVLGMYEWIMVRRWNAWGALGILACVGLLGLWCQDIFEVLELRGYSPWDRLCMQALLMPKYFGMIMLPDIGRYTIDHAVGVCHNAWWALMIMGALWGWGFIVMDRAGRFMLLGLSVMMVPEFTIMNLELVFEHRLYPLLAMGCCCVGRIRAEWARGLVGIAVAYCCVVNVQYQCAWLTQKSLWEHAVRVYPESFRAHLNMAKMTYQESPSRALYHLGELRKCKDLKNGVWTKEARWVYGVLSEKMRDDIIEIQEWYTVEK